MMPSNSILLTDRSRELNRQSESLREESDLNDKSVPLRKTCTLPIQESTQVIQQLPGKESQLLESSATEHRTLHSWKEIASYMGFGVRTVQRYEQFLGLPIRRFAGVARSSVSAFTDELDRWMQTAGTHPIGRAEWEKAMKEIEELRSEVAHLRKIIEEPNKIVDSNGVNGRSRKPKFENRSPQLSRAS